MLDMHHLRQWIGRQDVRAETLTPALVERFAATFDFEACADAGSEAPPLIHFCLAPAAASTAGLGIDGHPARGDFLPPVPLPRRMWAGGALGFLAPIRVGETVSRTSTIRDVALKEGRTGPLCFVTVDHRITADGRPVLEERQDIVYRGAGTTGAPATPRSATPAPAPPGRHRLTVSPSALLLFRYSALTFNGHRIHYDAPYATQVEGYPGLVVHGPLQATLLAQFATRLRGKAPARFDFRALSPLFDDADFTLNANDDGDGLRLWTARVGGPAAMEARAGW